METEKDYCIIYKQKNTFESWQSVFFSSVFILWWIFFLKLTRTAWHGFPFRNCSTVVFAFWRGLCVVKGVEWLCIQFVKCNTGVILSQSTSTWQPLCARYVLPVGWSGWLHSSRWMYHFHSVKTLTKSVAVPLLDNQNRLQAGQGTWKWGLPA